MTKNRKTKLALCIGLVLAAAFLLWRGSKSPCWQLTGDVICRAKTNDLIVALSFDDGPTREGVDAVLPELEKRGVKATFFLIGKHMETAPGQAERIVAAGHELGNHSYSHVRMWGRSMDWYRDEIARTNALLQKAGVKNPILFRPPFGRRLFGLPSTVKGANMKFVTWDVGDDVAHHPTPQEYAQDIISRTKPGSIILIHPMYKGNHVERKALPFVLDGLLKKGYRIVPVGTLLGK